MAIPTFPKLNLGSYAKQNLRAPSAAQINADARAANPLFASAMPRSYQEDQPDAPSPELQLDPTTRGLMEGIAFEPARAPAASPYAMGSLGGGEAPALVGFDRPDPATLSKLFDHLTPGGGSGPAKSLDQPLGMPSLDAILTPGASQAPTQLGNELAYQGEDAMRAVAPHLNDYSKKLLEMPDRGEVSQASWDAAIDKAYPAPQVDPNFQEGMGEAEFLRGFKEGGGISGMGPDDAKLFGEALRNRGYVKSRTFESEALRGEREARAKKIGAETESIVAKRPLELDKLRATVGQLKGLDPVSVAKMQRWDDQSKLDAFRAAVYGRNAEIAMLNLDERQRENILRQAVELADLGVDGPTISERLFGESSRKTTKGAARDIVKGLIEEPRGKPSAAPQTPDLNASRKEAATRRARETLADPNADPNDRKAATAWLAKIGER